MNIFLSKKSLILLFSLSALTIQSEIIEITHFHEILNYVAPDSIVLHDINNTLLEPHPAHNSIGSDQWFTHYMQTHQNFDHVLKLYCCVVLNTLMQTVEPTIPEVLQSIQEQALLLGFTMRSIILAPCTVEQLAGNNIISPNNYPTKVL